MLNKSKKAYVTLITVIVVGAISVAAVVFMLKNGIMFTQNSNEIINSYQADFLAESCLEEALERIRDNTSFIGGDNIYFSNGSCSFLVSNSTPGKTIESTGVSINNVKKIRAEVSNINPIMIISSWERDMN